MQYITIESSVRSAFIWSKWFRLILAIILLLFSISYFLRAYAADLLIYYSLSVMSLAGGVLVFINFFKGPFLIVNSDGLQFKVTLRDSVHKISWEQLQGIRIENKIVHFQMIEGEWPVYFNCSKNNLVAIKRVLRHDANRRNIQIQEQEF